jgi:hypothetical protein
VVVMWSNKLTHDNISDCQIENGMFSLNNQKCFRSVPTEKYFGRGTKTVILIVLHTIQMPFHKATDVLDTVPVK